MTIRLKFHGAARTVTGSCYMLETGKGRILIDCGMFQGSKTERELNYRDFPFRPADVHALLLTHAHIDHAGLIPKLVKHGFGGKIHCTDATRDLCAIMLPDSGFIQETEVKQLNERNRKKGLAEVEPIYTLMDAEACLEHFSTIAMENWFSPLEGIRARYWNAGHLLGSASIEVEVTREGQKPLRLLFSGDIGPDHKMLERDPEAPAGFDCIVCESTYGGRDRFERSQQKRREILADELKAAAGRGGPLLIPSFAVERTQEVVTDLVWLMDHGLAPRANIFIDSPLASKATAVFRKYAQDLENGTDLARAFASDYVKTTESVEDSKALARFTGFHIIIAASGMAEAGRIRHHLKNNLWRNKATVLLVGFQAAGSLGYLLESGEKMVRIMGEEIRVTATIRRFEDYSGHADGPELVQWLRERMPVQKSLFLTHGEEEAQLALAADLQDGIVPADCIIRPRLDDVYDLEAPQCALLAEESKPRIDPLQVARLDWHNDLQGLVLDISEEIKKQADDKTRSALIRRLRRALTGDSPTDPGRRRPPLSGTTRRQRGWDE
jgi:metallo-beta-lactamase family protein